MAGVLVGAEASELPARPAEAGLESTTTQQAAPIQHTLILRLRHVKHPVLVRRFTSFLCLADDSALFSSPGIWYRICAFVFTSICGMFGEYPAVYCPIGGMLFGRGAPIGACGICSP